MCIFFSFLLSDARTCLHVFVGVKWKASRGAFHVRWRVHIHIHNTCPSFEAHGREFIRRFAQNRSKPAGVRLSCSQRTPNFTKSQPPLTFRSPMHHHLYISASLLRDIPKSQHTLTHTHNSSVTTTSSTESKSPLQSTMAKLTAVVALLMVLAAATAGAVVTNADDATATVPVPVRHKQQTRRSSRFLLANSSPPPTYYACSKKSAAAVCFAPGSPGATCCGGRCVDTAASADHCGGCSKVCKHDRSTCCGGRCVDLLSDKGNCGACGNLCDKRCSNGFCDYAL
jgi:hypothetical protein